ncbi:plasmodesmata-located protein 8 [Rhodamnia argentea]|uniref:Plasmodesmata-located protein 8 n=1 Tax=Rhodamnia argentea TaxID=178133 RepID=A0ABM3H619_9MYRT|nr:plasmodesmata-located protein 8 [Rhodamnia argentea]
MARILRHHSSYLFLLFALFLNPVHPVRPSTYIYSGCSQEKYQPSSLFELNLDSVLSSFVSSSSRAAYGSFAVGNGTSAPPEGSVYGLYQCRGDLKLADCSRCIQSAVSQMSLVCPYSYGASLQLDGCYVRYEHTDFLGKVDTGLRYQKCGRGSESDQEFFRRRDDVLADLKTALGFRVSSLGMVEGFAQCLGDQSAADCSACISQAVEELKTLCGSAAAADVFLAQCYARYWASGYYDSSDSSNNEDQGGKTVAILVGVVAGLAILIVLLSLCRKAMS